MRRNETDIIVAGTGPAGLAAAIAFADAGFSVALAGPPPRLDDRRTTALMLPSLRFLETLGLRDTVTERSAPLRTMRIVDATRRLIRADPVTFRAGEIGETAFGQNIPNAALLAILEAAVSARPSITRAAGLVDEWRLAKGEAVAMMQDGAELAARLVAAADGRNSPAREAAGLHVAYRALAQSALVLNFGHSREHGFVSTEFHTETGPFTQVPLPGRRSSLVWVERPEEAQRLAGLDDAALSRLVEERMQSMLGSVEVEPGRQVYPLATATPSSFGRGRVALVGEAAHVFPPIGAQGLNLGLRDVRDLVRCASRHRADPGSDAALSLYSARRRPDVFARSGAVNMLNYSLLTDMLPAQIARSAGLGLLGALAPLRALVMREGLEPGSGFAGLFSGLRVKVRGQ